MKRNAAKHDQFFLDCLRRRVISVENGIVYRHMVFISSAKLWRFIEPKRADFRTTDGYYRVRIRYRTCSAHRIVWMSHHGMIDSNLEINHKNGIKNDNRIENLELVTASENSKHAFTMPRKRIVGSLNYAAILTEAKVIEIRRRVKAGACQARIAPEYGVSDSTINAVCEGRTWRHVPMED